VGAGSPWLVRAGPGPAQSSVFGGLHVLLLKFYSSVAHGKVAGRRGQISKTNNRVLSSLEVIILWWPSQRLGVSKTPQPQRDSLCRSD
jgi:hypothetical protein